MPSQLCFQPCRLEGLCVDVYLRYLYDEVRFISHLRRFESRSVLLQRYGLDPERLQDVLQRQMSSTLTGILHDIVRQKMVDKIISRLDSVVTELRELAAHSNRGYVSTSSTSHDHVEFSKNIFQSATVQLPHQAHHSVVQLSHQFFATQCRQLPIIRLLELVLHRELKTLDFGQNKCWREEASGDGTATERLADVARVLWKMVGERCDSLEKLVVPKELSYSSTLNAAIRNNGASLTFLTLKRNVPNNMFLSVVGRSCPNLKELDIAGAEVVTDFGVVCLLFADPEQIFLECWNREKTVGSFRRSLRAFPHPHFDKPIPDPAENSTGVTHQQPQRCSQFLHLRKNFHDVIREPAYEWERLPICSSLEKLRLENTRVKGDGASVVLEVCPRLYSLGYLVFAAAGLKQVFGYERPHDTAFTEIFYRGPSDQKLLTIANCCSRLKTMFLGSNSVRRMNATVFSSWPHLQFLTLENIVAEDVSSCLELIGRQLKGLKVQCSGLDLAELASCCPGLQSLIIQKEAPLSQPDQDRLLQRRGNLKNGVFKQLKDLEVTCCLPKACFNFIMTHAVELRSVKVLQISGLQRDDVERWAPNLIKLKTLLIFRGPQLDREAVDVLLDSLPSLRVLGDFSSFDIRHPADIKRIVQRARDERWDLTIVETGSNEHAAAGITGVGSASNAEERFFSKMLSLHWFYLTDNPLSATSSSTTTTRTISASGSGGF